MAKVKICGITNYEDALWATNLGADYLGFNFYKKSPRKVSVENAYNIISKLPPFIEPVGVFVNEKLKNIIKISEKCKFKSVQLHGDEKPSFCHRLRKKGLKVIKAFRIKEEGDIEKIKDYIGFIDFLLLDTYIEDIPGGTGQTFNWELAKKAKVFDIPIFLAGGLTPENVKEAIKTIEPYCVDVASGVERSPKKKDFQKLKEFIRNAKKIANPF